MSTAGRLQAALTKHLDLVVGLSVLIVVAIALLVLRLGPHPFDPATYFEAGLDFPWSSSGLFSLRIGLVGSVAAALFVFGPSEAAFYAVPIAAGLALAGAVYATMVVLFRDRVLGAAAALVTVLSPVYLLNASSIFPDNVGAATLSLAFLLLIIGSESLGTARSSRAQLIAAALAGVLLGWTYLIREFSPIFLPAVAAAVILLGYSWRKTLALSAAALLTASLELLFGAVRWGDPFMHAQQLIDHAGPGKRPRPRVAEIQSQLDDPLDTLLVFPRLLLSWQSGLFLLVLLALFVGALVFIRDRRLWVLGAWCFVFWIIMAGIGLGSFSSGKWILNITNVRYWYPVLPPLVMGGFAGAALLTERFLPGRARFVPVGAAALALVMITPGIAEFRSCASKSAWRNDERSTWLDLRTWFASPESSQYGHLWTDWWSHRIVPAYTSTAFGGELWDGSIHFFDELESDTVPPLVRGNTMILFSGTRHLWRASPRDPSPLLGLRDDGWRPVFVTGDGAAIVLAHDPARSIDAGPWWNRPSPRNERVDSGSCGLNPYER